MKNRVYLRAFELDDYKTTIAWRRDEMITNQLGGVNYMSLRREKRNG